jgi:hypothetical protein
MNYGLKSGPDFEWLKQDGLPFEIRTKVVLKRWPFESRQSGFQKVTVLKYKKFIVCNRPKDLKHSWTSENLLILRSLREISLQEKGIYRLCSCQPTKKLVVLPIKNIVVVIKQPSWMTTAHIVSYPWTTSSTEISRSIQLIVFYWSGWSWLKFLWTNSMVFDL